MKCYRCGANIAPQVQFCAKCEAVQGFSAELLTKALHGDQTAIAELYNRTYNSVYHTIKSMIRDEDAVLDILQDSYIKGFQHLRQLDKPENYRAWMKRIAANNAKDYLKKKRPMLFSELQGENGEVELPFADERTENLPEACVDRQETTHLVNEILNTLGEDQRLIVGMFYYENLSIKQIAGSLGCSENTIKSRLYYARQKIEIKVRELERRGTKLYTLAPVPFLIWLLRSSETQAAQIPSSAVLSMIQKSCAAISSGMAGTGTTVSAKANIVQGPVSTAPKAAVGLGAKAAAGAAGKVLAGKIAAAVLAVAVVGGGTAAVVALGDHDEPKPPAMGVEESYPVQRLNADMAYHEILIEYASACSMDDDTYFAEGDRYENAYHSTMMSYHSYDGGEFYYAFYDVDENGTSEMIIGYGEEGMQRIADVYGFSGSRAVKFLDQPALGERAHLTIMEDGSMQLFGSTGANSGMAALYRITDDGHSLETVYAFDYEFTEDGIIYYNDQERLSGDQFSELNSGNVPVENFEWISLDGYIRDITGESESETEIELAIEEGIMSIYYVEGGQIKSEEQRLPYHGEDVFEAWKLKNGLGDDVKLIRINIEDNGEESVYEFEGSEVAQYTVGDYFAYHIVISADIENYYNTIDQQLLMQSLEQTMTGYSHIEYDEFNIELE